MPPPSTSMQVFWSFKLSWSQEIQSFWRVPYVTSHQTASNSSPMEIQMMTLFNSYLMQYEFAGDEEFYRKKRGKRRMSTSIISLTWGIYHTLKSWPWLSTITSNSMKRTNEVPRNLSWNIFTLSAKLKKLNVEIKLSKEYSWIMENQATTEQGWQRKWKIKRERQWAKNCKKNKKVWYMDEGYY